MIEWILQDKNLTTALNRVIANKGAPGIDNMTVEEVRDYFETIELRSKHEFVKRSMSRPR